MAAFAKSDNRVLFIENTGVRTPTFKDIRRLTKRIVNWFKSSKGFREEAENLYIYSPLILPFPYSRISRWINKYLLLKALKRWMKAMEFRDPIIWTFLPTGTALDIINNIDRKLLIYYCIADFYELADNYKKVKKTEDELIKECDLIFVQGRALEEKCRRLNNNVRIFPFGVSIETFEKFRYSADKVPDDIRGVKKPIIGYIGGIHKHIDFALLKFIAQSHPEWSLVLIGPLQTEIQGLDNFKNVFILGKKDFSELPYYSNEFSVCIIPYQKTGYTTTVYPTKLNEYHALGKPVVSTDLPEIENFNKENGNLVLIGKTHEEFVRCIIKMLNESANELPEKRRCSARKNSWATRIEEMSSLMDEAIRKKSVISVDWQEKFLRLYKKGRGKILKSALLLLTLYFLFFYTPLVWFMAGPLKIVQPPQKADAIVSLAGGVGESGKAGQGYEERVQYAVELYKKGYASHIIFSSGYKYVFEEPLVMKALAISLGVPAEAIILEEKASNTYENIKFVKGILDNRGWKKVLLISSPFHMLRVSLVARKISPELEVIYTPILDSNFYSYKIGADRKLIGKQLTIDQAKALIHEYLGILYYLWKGYI